MRRSSKRGGFTFLRSLRRKTKKSKPKPKRSSKTESKMKQECTNHIKTEKTIYINEIEFEKGVCYYYDDGGNRNIYEKFYKGLKKKYGKKSYNPKNYKIDYNYLKTLKT